MCKQLFQSFCDYFSENGFEYQSFPRIEEMIDLEDIMWPWAEQHDGNAIKDKDPVQKLRYIRYMGICGYIMLYTGKNLYLFVYRYVSIRLIRIFTTRSLPNVV